MTLSLLSISPALHESKAFAKSLQYTRKCAIALNVIEIDITTTNHAYMLPSESLDSVHVLEKILKY